MSGKGEERISRQQGLVREHLANERTLLAWVRTGLALVSIGLVVERAGALVVGASGRSNGVSEAFGLALAALGCLALVIGTVQFLRNRRRISEGTFTPAASAYLVLVAGGLLLAGAFIFYVLLL